MNIRRAASFEASRVADLSALTFRETFESFYDKDDFEAFIQSTYNESKIASEINDPACAFFLAESEGEIVGYAMVKESSPEPCVTGPSPIEIQRIYAIKKTLGKGVGPALMEACIAHAKEKGGETLWLGVWEHNERAKVFYTRLGFTDVGSHIFKVGRKADVDRIMVMDLRRP